MKCWRCGKGIDDNSGECIYCHAGQRRSVPATKEGAALRELYDHYGADMVFGNPVLLVNGFGDLVSDTLSVDVKKTKNNLKAATDAGIGKPYLEKLSVGNSSPDFDARVKKILIEDADMNKKAADRLIGWFDEMIGGKPPKAEPQNPVVIPQPKDEPKAETPPPLPAQPKPKKLPAWIWITILLAVGILGYFMYQNNQQGIRVGDTISLSRYEQDQWIGADPIEWQVLAVENGRALLLSRYGLEAKQYHNTKTGITWKKSDIRAWLNGTFYNSAFSSSEKKRIQDVWNSNPDNPDDETEGGKDTKDKFFLLSIDEDRNYLTTNTSRECQGTYIAKQNSALVFDNGNSWWSLRSPGLFSSFHAAIDPSGGVETMGLTVLDDHIVVRPALWLNL